MDIGLFVKDAGNLNGAVTHYNVEDQVVACAAATISRTNLTQILSGLRMFANLDNHIKISSI
jgi:hypothetical protein